MVARRPAKCNARNRSGASERGIGIIKFMRRLSRLSGSIVVGICLSLNSLWLHAVEVTGLYEAELPVMSQGRAERQEVTRSGLLEVLIKITGNTNIALSPGIPQLLNRSSQFVQQYRYRNVLDQATTTTPVNRQFLWVRFDKPALDSRLRDLGLAIWGRSRPSTLAWVVVSQAGGKRTLLGNDDGTDLSKIITTMYQRRGIPLRLPLLDIEDQNTIRVTDVSAGFQDTILRASQRYAPEAVLVGNVRQLTNQRWQARWRMTLAGREYSWSREGDIDEVVGFGVDNVTSVLASNFIGTNANQEGEVVVLVTDIFTLEDYSRSSQYLASLDGVMSVEPERVDERRILYKVKLLGDQQSLLQSVRLSSRSVLTLLDTPNTAPIPPGKTVSLPALKFKLLP